MNRTVQLVLTVAALTLIALGVVTFMGGDDAPEFGKGSYEEIEEAVTGAGIELDVGETGDADITGGYEKTTYTMSTKTTADDGLLVVRAFSGPDQLDAIKEDTYVGDSALGFRWMQFSISVTASTPPAVIDLFRDAMDQLGASQLYDHFG